MHSVSIAFGPAATQWVFLFQDEAKARKAREQFSITGRGSEVAVIQDDFGQIAEIRCDSVHAVLLEDKSKTADAQVEIALQNGRTQARAQELANTDPALRAAAHRSQLLQPGPFPRG